jgi:hypothetical protein
MLVFVQYHHPLHGSCVLRVLPLAHESHSEVILLLPRPLQKEASQSVNCYPVNKPDCTMYIVCILSHEKQCLKADYCLTNPIVQIIAPHVGTQHS